MPHGHDDGHIVNRRNMLLAGTTLAASSALGSVAATIPATLAQAQTAGSKPNIILITSDDFGYGDAGVYGGGPGRGMPTPNIDRLADEGMTSSRSTASRAAPRAAQRCKPAASPTAAA